MTFNFTDTLGLAFEGALAPFLNDASPPCAVDVLLLLAAAFADAPAFAVVFVSDRDAGAFNALAAGLPEGAGLIDGADSMA